MGKEEQVEEREVLDSIFPEEIHDVSEKEYRISITLDFEAEPGEESQNPTIILNVRYPDAYPDVAPDLDITQPPNAPKHQYLDVQNDKANLLESLLPTIEESLGMAMVFSLVSALKEAAEILMGERKQAEQTQRDMEIRRAEEEENKKFEGEKVTRETFLAWRDQFRKEMAEAAARLQAEAEAEERKKRGGKLEEKKLTGKQLWEQGLAGKTLEVDEDGEDAVESMQRLQVAS